MEDLQEENRSKASIKGWSKEEKFYLYLALKAHGSFDIEKVQEYLTTKSAADTQRAVDYYKHIAMQHPMFEKKRQLDKTRSHRKPRVPLTRWAKMLTDSLKFSELCTELPTVLRLIADLENIPSPVCTDTVDFRQVYYQIANAMEGKTVIPDLVTTAVLHKCIVETALSSKAFIKTTAFKYVINNVEMPDKEINIFPRPTKNKELAILRHLSSQRRYNPLMVPEDYLTPSCEKTWDDGPNTSS